MLGVGGGAWPACARGRGQPAAGARGGGSGGGGGGAAAGSVPGRGWRRKSCGVARSSPGTVNEGDSEPGTGVYGPAMDDLGECGRRKAERLGPGGRERALGFPIPPWRPAGLRCLRPGAARASLRYIF